MAHKIPTGNVKKRRRNTSFDMNPVHQQDGSQDSPVIPVTPPYNGVTSPEEPGLSTIDLELEIGSDFEVKNNFVQDGEPSSEKLEVIVSSLKQNTYRQGKNEKLVPDNCEIDVGEHRNVDEKVKEEKEFEEDCSANECSEQEEVSDAEESESDYEGEDINEDIKKRLWISEEQVRYTKYISHFMINLD